MQSTVQLFRHLYNSLPPLVSRETKIKMKHALNYFESAPPVVLEKIEDTMIEFGYEVWPWNKAFQEFLVAAEAQVGEHFLLPKLTPELQQRYSEFKLYGGTLRELHSGRPASFFSGHERVDLAAALVEMEQELWAFASHEVIGISQNKYLARVAEFTAVLEEIKSTLEHLAGIAENEQDHPTLANEIRSHIRSFEYGLCLLGPEPDVDKANGAAEFFQGRRLELNRFKGIHQSIKVDFYS